MIDCSGADARAGMTVVVQGERIRAVGPVGEVAVPAGATVVDSSGKFMIPGLWDMHVHNGARAAGLNLVNGVTGNRVMWGADDHTQSHAQAGDVGHLKARDRAGEMGNRYDGTEREIVNGIALRGGVDRPFIRSLVASWLLDGPNPLWPTSRVISNAGEARRAVRDYVELGSDFIKVYEVLSRESYFAIAEESKRLGIPFAGHVPVSVSAGEASDAGQASIEHMTHIFLACSSEEDALRAPHPYNINLTRVRETYDEQKARALFAKFVENGTWQVPTRTVRYYRPFANDPGLTRDPRLRFIKRGSVLGWRSRANRYARRPQEVFDHLRSDFARDQQLVGDMHRAGVRFLAGTDTANPFCLPGFSLHDEMALLVDAGLSEMEALQAATRNPAEFMGRLGDLGTVEPGKLADLVLLDANPLEDIDHTTRIASVVFNGRHFERGFLDAILAEHALEHSVLRLADSYTEEAFEALVKNPMVQRVQRLRVHDRVIERERLTITHTFGSDSGRDASLLFRQMPRLEAVYLSKTDLNDRGLARLVATDHIKTLEVGETQITDAGLLHIQKMERLEGLSLKDTAVADAGFKRLVGLKRLKSLDLSGTQITPAAMRQISGYRRLESLALGRTPVTDKSLGLLGLLSNLASLSLADTGVGDAGLRYLSQIKTIKSLDLTNTRVSVEAVERFKREMPDCALTIANDPQLAVTPNDPAGGKYYREGAPIVNRPTRAVGGGAIARVDFLIDGQVVGARTVNPFEWSYRGVSRGRHVIGTRVYDRAGELVDAQTRSVYVGVRGMERAIASGADDVEEQADGVMYPDSSDLELVRDGGRGNQVIGLRFTDVTIPRGARITKAHVQFALYDDADEPTRLVIRAERTPDAAAFTAAERNVSSRTRTEASVTWEPPAWEDDWAVQGEAQRTPDLSDLIQEVVSREGWRAGNALVVTIEGKGHRQAVTYDMEPFLAPTLYVEYETEDR
ncbi:MAG: amidohydrolase family protein [Planctomycetota bacterium]